MSEIQSEIAPTRLHHSARPGGVPRYLLEGKVPERAALLMIGEERSYGDLTAASIAVARWLVGSGGRKGDRALIVAENGYFWVAAYLGTLSAGMVAVPLPPTIDDEDLSYVIEYTEPRAAFVERRLVRRVGNHLGGIPLLTDALIPSLLPTPFADGENRRWDAVDAGLPPVVESDLASLLFTSGSTGRPRGVMLSHGNIIANADSIIAFLGLTGKDRVMAVLPFHYCFGTSLLHTHLRVGGTLVIERRFMYPEKVLERMRETKCTGFAGVPSHYQVLLRRSSLKKMSFPHLRYVQQAGGHLAPAYIRELREALPSAQIFIMYGQTEATARLAYLPPDMIDAKAGSIGKAIPGVELRIVNEAGQPIRPVRSARSSQKGKISQRVTGARRKRRPRGSAMVSSIRGISRLWTTTASSLLSVGRPIS